MLFAFASEYMKHHLFERRGSVVGGEEIIKELKDDRSYIT